MSIILALCFGGFFGFLVGACWRIEKMEALEKANAKLLEELHNAQNVFRTKQKTSWVH